MILTRNSFSLIIPKNYYVKKAQIVGSDILNMTKKVIIQPNNHFSHANIAFFHHFI